MTVLSWAKESQVLVINAPTCGLNKDGVEQYEVDPLTGARKPTIADELARISLQISKGKSGGQYTRYVPANEIRKSKIAVPCYYDRATVDGFDQFISRRSTDFEPATIGELVGRGDLVVRKGHGSPSSDQRVGNVPYIKVSDLRAGLININPSNRVPRPLAEKFWKSEASGLRGYDLICPERASKNIGEFCVLLPGQEDVVLTREVLIMRGVHPRLTQFFLMWALSLSVVRDQWKRIVFMQTNREDVGNRYLEIKLPFPKFDEVSDRCSKPFKEYFETLRSAKGALRRELTADGEEFHLFFA